MRIALLALISLPALAWEPTSPPAVQARIAELDKAWAGKSPDEIAQDKAARSRQPRPAWVDKGTFKMELAPLTYYFAVGKAAFGSGKGAPQKTSTSGRPIDWWYDADAGALYTLVVDAR